MIRIFKYRHPGLDPGPALFLLATLGLATPAAAQPAAAPAPIDYTRPAYWLCLPGRADICSTPLPTTALTVRG